MSAGVCTTSPSSGWLRRASNGSLRASKASLSVLASGSALATIDERETIPTPGLTHQALGARATLCFSKPDVHPTMVDHSGLPTPTTPGRRRFVHPGPIGVSEARSDSESDDGGVDSGFGFRVVEQGGQVPVSSCGLADACMPSSPSSSRYTSTSDDSGVQIVRAHRIHTARARAHSIDEVIGKRQLLSPPPDQIHSLPPPLGLTEAEAINYGLSTPRTSPRSFVPAPASPLSPAFRQRIIPNLLEHINEDDAESHSSHASSLSAPRSVRSASIPTTKHSLPPPPRPRNKALIRPSQSQSLPCTPLPPDNSDLTRIQKSELAPALAPPAPHRPSRSTPRRGPPSLAIPPPPSSRDSTEVKSRHSSASLHSLPLSPAVPASAATPAFPQSPHSTVFFTCSEPISPQRSTFLPSCRATSIDSGTFQEDPSSPRQSKDRRDSAYRTYRTSALSTLSNPFGEFSFLKPYAKHRASGVSFASNVSGSSARCATEAESIPIGLHRPSHECEQEYLPISPRSSVFGIDIDTTSPSDDDTESVVTEEESKKSSVFVRGRAKSLNLPRVPVASLNKVDRILGLGASHALINRHVHVPHLSISTMSSEDAPVEPAQQSFLPSAGPPSAFSMGNLGRKLSKKSTSTERRRSEDVQRSSSANSGRLMARVGEFIGRTPSPGGRARDLDSEDESPSPPPIPTFPQPAHRRKHSSSDPSSGLAPILNDRPSTTNIRTAAERAEMIKKTRKIQQLLGDIPSSGEASTFYKIPRAAKSEDSVPSLVVPGASEEVKRGYHRSTASLSSRPLLSLSPGLTSPAFPISATTDDFGLGLISPSASSPLAAAQPLEGEPEHEDDAAEDETTLARRAKRAKVAKLHRYLGSRVPAHLVLGLDDKWDYEHGLPEVRSEDEGASGSGLIPGRKKRRASDGDYALLDETMGDLSVMSVEEKARAVRRKAKMEKMFGENPPQRLYQPQGDAAKNDAEEALEDDSDRGAHYRSYRASFNSLAYFVDNADRDSLEGLYDIISNPTGPDDDEDEEEARNQFEVRRKRAAKLSDFFGVSFRDLFGAVLDVLENDVREDKEQGSLSAIETQDLLMKLRRLKAKGEKIHI